MKSDNYENQEDELIFAEEDEENPELSEASETAEEPEEASTWKILIADDDVEVHRVTRMVLSDFVFENKKLTLLSSYSAAETQFLLRLNPDIAVVLLDVVMERDTSGLEVVRYIREQLGNRLLRIILRTGQPGQAPEHQVVAQYDINDYREKTELTTRKMYTALISALRAYRDIETIRRLNEEIDRSQKEIIFTLGEIAETRSKETGHHVKRVAEYSGLLAELAGLPESECELIRMASPMHDIGKIAISDDILNKPGRLTPEEYAIMQTHSEVGHSMLKHSERPIMKAAASIALQHHEKYDGSGYPAGLAGEEIHLYGRIVAVADVFDALASERVYKKAWEPERIVALFAEERGRHFDPRLTDLFLDHIDEFWKIRNLYE
ncbi:hypothetical protein CDO73_08945 [Saccharibacillus sp. O23]|uniref:HD-GYP domain-containing protein n=1 Tax=Saccharibacillus sp. O23 TaxID=2009338 RepID=UPI000B4E60A0|nr:HD domain-containing phosphohydrolase [Saccharibacillus sp. O23]OWR30714.1 hypothetical protein CDO73_08945 [Saccharibacillus sp. O23]